MSTKETLLAVINEMSEPQMHALLTFLNTFSQNPVDVVMPAVQTDGKETVRAGMMKTLQDRMNALDYSSPNTENVLKELKDMLNMLLRV